MGRRTIAAGIALALGWAGCGGAAPAEETCPRDGTGGPATGTSAGGEASAPSDVDAMLVDVVAPRLCESLRGSFVGLPGEGGASGPASGGDPTVGRWWIRQCQASAQDGVLSLSIDGTGWTWIDRETMGFQIRQYLRFDAHAAFHATMDVGYDAASHIATIWMRPGPDVEASVSPRGLVDVQSTNVLSGMLGGLLELTGESATQRARAQVADEGSQRLRERFGAGFTVTFSMANEQMDFMVGALARGQVPVRPYPAETGVTWSVNQRMQIWPGGLDVLGPMPEGQGTQALDLDLEEGAGVLVDAACSADFERFYDQSLQGGSPAPPTGRRILDLAHTGASRVEVPALGCPTLLLVTTPAGAQLPSRMRARITPADAPTATRQAQLAAAAAAAGTPAAGAPTGAGTAPVASRPVRIQLLAMTLSPVAPTGNRWDLIGSEPDPYVIVVSIPGQREVERTEAVADRHEVALDHFLPGAFRPEDLPLRFSVYDDDVGSDELIGVGDLSSAQLTSAAGGEVHLELRSQETVPHVMGTIRLRAQPLP